VGLGQAGGPAGIAVLLRTGTKPPSYAAVHLKRWSADTDYTAVAR
jgi:hypothetical protein